MTSPSDPSRTPGHHPSTDHRRRDDAGGVWIAIGVLLGVLVYGLVVLMDVAGFTEVLPLVVIPPVVVGLIGANSLLGGGRGQRRSVGRPVASAEPAGPDVAGSTPQVAESNPPR